MPRVMVTTEPTKLIKTDGAAEPDRISTVNGSGLLTAITVDNAGPGYLSDVTGNAIYSFDNIVTFSGPHPQDRTIEGDQTSLGGPVGLFLLEQ